MDITEALNKLLSSLYFELSFGEPLKQPLANMFGAEQQVEEEEGVERGLRQENSQELLMHSLTHYMDSLLQQHRELNGHLLHAVLTDQGDLILFMTEEGSRYCSLHSNEIKQSAELKLGVSRSYFAEVDANEPLTRREIEDVVDSLVKDGQRSRSARILDDHAISYPQQAEEDLLYSLEELCDLTSYRGLSTTRLSRQLCREILDHLWAVEKETLLNQDENNA